jgi:murein DD-endopeptidase MepM/ murein hydrolase activator NlpD
LPSAACAAIVRSPPPPLLAMDLSFQNGDGERLAGWSVSKPNPGVLPLILDVSRDTSGFAKAPLVYIPPGGREVVFSAETSVRSEALSFAMPRIAFARTMPAEGKHRHAVTLHFPVDWQAAQISQTPRDGAGFLRARSHTEALGGQHEAVDIDAPLGTPIRAPADGVVADAYDANPDLRCNFTSHRGYGNYVVVVTDDDVSILLGHIKRDSVVVQPGTRVRRGDPIAEVGHSGSGDRSHLHLAAMALGVEGVDSVPIRFDACGDASNVWTPRNGSPCRSGDE